MVLAWGLYEVTVRYQLRLKSAEVSAGAGGSTFQGGSLTWLASQCWLLAGGCSPFLCSLLHRAAKASHGWETDFPPKKESKRLKRKLQYFL